MHLESIWKELGLFDEFRAAFPTNEDFWSANEPFIEIYRRLKAQSQARLAS
jgi:hypothetical protein